MSTVYTEQEEIEQEQTAEEPEEQEEQTEEIPEGEEEYSFDDGTKFKDQKSALEHAKKTIQNQNYELAKANAYQQAAQDLYQKGLAPAPVPATEESLAEWETQFFADPKKALDQIEKKVEQRVLTAAQRASEDAQIEAAWKAENPDIAHLWKLALMSVEEEPGLFRSVAQTKGQKAARDLAAQKVRSQIDAVTEARKPKKQLESTRTVTQPAGQSSVTPKKQETKLLTMVEQIASLKKGKR